MRIDLLDDKTLDLLVFGDHHVVDHAGLASAAEDRLDLQAFGVVRFIGSDSAPEAKAPASPPVASPVPSEPSPDVFRLSFSSSALMESPRVRVHALAFTLRISSRWRMHRARRRCSASAAPSYR